MPTSANTYNRRAKAILSTAGVMGTCKTVLADARELDAAARTTVRWARPSTQQDVELAFSEARGDYADLGPYCLRSGVVIVTWLRPVGARTDRA